MTRAQDGTTTRMPRRILAAALVGTGFLLIGLLSWWDGGPVRDDFGWGSHPSLRFTFATLSWVLAGTGPLCAALWWLFRSHRSALSPPRTRALSFAAGAVLLGLPLSLVAWDLC